MTQFVTNSFAALSAQRAKKLDYLFVIAGWPTIYSVARADYALAGDLANFSSIQAWADIPVAEGAAIKGRPEEGRLTIGQCEITILDRQYKGVRQMTDLLSRQAYMEGNSPGAIATLTHDLPLHPVDDSIHVTSTAGFPSSGSLYVGMEYLSYSSTTPTTFQGLSRGHLLTSYTTHKYGANLYSFMPNIYRRRAFLYKGYQNLPVDQWARAFGGVIVGAEKQGPAVTFTLASTTWETFVNGEQRAFGKPSDPSIPSPYGTHQLLTDVLEGDYNVESVYSGDATNLGNGHHLIDIGGYLHGITQVVVP